MIAKTTAVEGWLQGYFRLRRQLHIWGKCSVTRIQCSGTRTGISQGEDLKCCLIHELDACVWAKAFYIPALVIGVAGVAKWQTQLTQNQPMKVMGVQVPPPAPS
jgi:hypothetical protein